MTIDDQVRNEKFQYNINKEAAKISALSSVKLVTKNILLVKKYYRQINSK